ncbi:MAG: patatin-like protein, partial [Rhizonema sp. PD38]|nr:patatin-like protein [Rhizonema sp. PD38]
MPSKLKKPAFSHEHRLGLVVYGGVSLAIYMNGICQEFYNAVRGRGIYKLIKALTDADIVVDIISGTSAGGINGVLLSYALANSRGKKTDSTQEHRSEIKFEEFASVWKDSGDIQKLLFDKKDDGCDKTSFFNGVGYYKSEIKKALKERAKDLNEPAPEDDWFSEFGELDLFVTGTDTLGRIYQVFDNTGCVIDVKDHHTIFHLKYREYEDKNPFQINNSDDITYEALAKLCQITSCFPVAFPSVTVMLPDPQDHELTDREQADQKLVEWGKLKKNRLLPDQKPIRSDLSKKQDEKIIDDDPGEGYRLHFVDGGVLDNRPFSYTIKEIYHRRADRPVFRKLFYIDPSPDHFYNNDRYKQMLKPDIVQVVLDSLTRMPRYESINNDLEQIKEHNLKIRRYKFLMADIEDLLDKKVPPDRENNDIYDQQKNVYLRTRLISLKDNIL